MTDTPPIAPGSPEPKSEPPAWAVELAEKIFKNLPHYESDYFVLTGNGPAEIAALIADYFAVGPDVEELERLLAIKDDFAEVSEFGIQARELVPDMLRTLRAQAAEIRALKAASTGG